MATHKAFASASRAVLHHGARFSAAASGAVTTHTSTSVLALGAPSTGLAAATNAIHEHPMPSVSVVRGLSMAVPGFDGRSERDGGFDGGATGPGVWASGIGAATAVVLMYHADAEPRVADGGMSLPIPRVGAAAAMESLRRNGLISTWDDSYFTRTLPDPTASGKLLTTPGLLWAAVELDAAAAKETPAAYMARVLQRSVSFFETNEADGLPRVINHEGTLTALLALGSGAGKGQFVLLTGPRSVGKSLMLQKVAKAQASPSRRVLYVDAREHGTDLTAGIVASIAEDKTFYDKMVGFLSKAIAAADVTAAVRLMNTVVEGEVVISSKAASAGEPPLTMVLGSFFQACKANREYPVIFIDEANIAFGAAEGDAAAKARVLGELQLFTRISKQQREASVVLATSEHGLPFRLRALGFNTDHIDKTIVAEEVAPAAMKRELMQSWGCGEHLSTALLSMYGGHVRHLSAAVRELATSTAPAALRGIHALTSIDAAPAACLSDATLKAAAVPKEEWVAVRAKVTAALEALVLRGSYPLEAEDDKVAEIISLANAGVVVPLRAAASGVRPEAWQALTPMGEEPKYMLVPSSNIMRLLIASKVFPPIVSGGGAVGGAGGASKWWPW